MSVPLQRDLARMRLAWKSARFRAAAHREGTFKHVNDRDAWRTWARSAEAENVRLRAEITELRTQLATAERQNADLDERCAAAEHSTDHDYDEAAVPQ